MKITKRRLLLAVLSGLLFLGGILSAIEDYSQWWVAVLFGLTLAWYSFPNAEIQLRNWAFSTGVKWRKRQKERDMTRRASSESKVIPSSEGFQLLNELNKPLVPWNDLVEIHLVWEQNPWGDPQFGSYNDVYWQLTLSDSRKYQIEDSDVHRYFLIPAFSKNLPGYSFTYDGFAKVFTDKDGNQICWARKV